MLNEKIVYYRKKNMLTQEELAYQLNVSRQTVTKWETGTIYPNIEYLIKLSNLFGVSIDYLVDELKDIEPDEKTTFEMKISVKSKKVEKIEMNIKEDENITANILIENSENKVSIKVYDEGDSILELQIEKETNGNDVTYKIDVKTDLDTELADQEKAEIHLTVQYKNLATLDNVEENYELKLSTQDYYESNTDLKLNYTNVKQFSSNIEIEGINGENAITLNDATDDEIDELLITIYKNLGLY